MAPKHAAKPGESQREKITAIIVQHLTEWAAAGTPVRLMASFDAFGLSVQGKLHLDERAGPDGFVFSALDNVVLAWVKIPEADGFAIFEGEGHTTIEVEARGHKIMLSNAENQIVALLARSGGHPN